MPNTFELIASYTASGSVSSIDFTSIAGTYTDLCLQLSIRTADTGLVYDGLKVTFNGSSSGYSDRMIYGDGSSAASASTSGTSTRFHYATTNLATSNTFCNTSLYIPNYAGSSYKSISSDSVTENNGTAVITVLDAALWSNTAAITSISIASNSGASIVTNSTAYLYGVKNA
jgi:hypothetical protein